MRWIVSIVMMAAILMDVQPTAAIEYTGTSCDVGDAKLQPADADAVIKALPAVDPPDMFEPAAALAARVARAMEGVKREWLVTGVLDRDMLRYDADDQILSVPRHAIRPPLVDLWTVARQVTRPMLKDRLPVPEANMPGGIDWDRLRHNEVALAWREKPPGWANMAVLLKEWVLDDRRAVGETMLGVRGEARLVEVARIVAYDRPQRREVRDPVIRTDHRLNPLARFVLTPDEARQIYTSMRVAWRLRLRAEWPLLMSARYRAKTATLSDPVDETVFAIVLNADVECLYLLDGAGRVIWGAVTW